MTPLRLTALSTSLATILVSSVFRQFSAPRNRLLYHWQRDDALALSLSVLALALLIAAVASACSRGSHRVQTWAKVLTCVLLVDVAIGHFLPISDLPPWGLEAAAATALLAVIAVAAWRWSEQCWRLCEQTILVLSPLCVVLAITAFGWRPITSGRERGASTERPPDKPPIIVMLFDEWSWRRASTGAEFRPELQRATLLSARATTFLNAKSPGSATFVSAPRILYGSDGFLVRDGERPLWEVDGVATAVTATGSVLSAATQAGYRGSMVGFYLPFGELIDASVTNVWSMPSTPKYDGLVGDMLLTGTKALRSFGDPVMRSAGHYAWMRQWQMSHVRLNRRLESKAVEALRKLEAGDVVWLHLPMPHAPFVFDRDGSVQYESWQGRQERDSLKYLEHLIYADKLLGRLLDVLQDRGLLERSMLVVTSDHGWRTDPGLVEATSYQTVTSVPLIVKWPHQRRPQGVSQPMCLSSLQLLLGPVEAGDTAMPSTAVLEELAQVSCDADARARDSLNWHNTPAMHR